MLAATDEALLDAHGRWYIAGRDPRHLRRNALVALGNVGDGADPATAEALARHIEGDDELLAEHARWAATRLGRTDLLVRDDGDGR
jgi:epoxyqueuosine reductase